MVFEAEADGIDKGASEGRRLRPELEASSNERARQRGSEGSGEERRGAGEERERSPQGQPRGVCLLDASGANELVPSTCRTSASVRLGLQSFVSRTLRLTRSEGGRGMARIDRFGHCVRARSDRIG